MNYGILFSTELQKMAREINFDPNKGAGDPDAQQKRMFLQRQMSQALSGQNSSGSFFSRLPGVDQPMVWGGAGKNLDESRKNSERARFAAEKSSPGSTRAPGFTLANR